MRNNSVYIIGAILVLFLGGLIIGMTSRQGRKMDERISLRQVDKIPYGTSVAKKLLPALFPKASIYDNKAHPASWEVISDTVSNQAVILVADHFNADEEELTRIFSFVKAGNYAFIIAKSFSYEALGYFNFSYNEYTADDLLNVSDDSLRLRLENPVFPATGLFVYPGKKYESSFFSLDTARTRVLGRTEDGRPDFIQMNTGKGSVFIHVAPLAFSNYFILHKNNIDYYQNALSVIPSSVNKILWNEYYLTKPREKEREPNWLGVLMKYPAFKGALLTGLATLFLYVLLGMRRRQRMIPQHAPPKNDSLDFVMTMGRLYYEHRDHKNLAVKMGTYFLDHVRTRYKIGSQESREELVRKLHDKTGYPQQDLHQMIGFIKDIENMPAISESQLANFHKQLELFYKNT